MSRPRPRRAAPVLPPVDTEGDTQPLDADALARELLAGINRFGGNKQ